MFKLMDRVPDGISPMLDDLVEHILQAGLDDMLASADVITQVNNAVLRHTFSLISWFSKTSSKETIYIFQDSEKYVERLLQLFNQFSLLVKDAFSDDPRFLTARDKAYKQVVNDTQVFRLELPSKQVCIYLPHFFKVRALVFIMYHESAMKFKK